MNLFGWLVPGWTRWVGLGVALLLAAGGGGWFAHSVSAGKVARLETQVARLQRDAETLRADSADLVAKAQGEARAQEAAAKAHNDEVLKDANSRIAVADDRAVRLERLLLVAQARAATDRRIAETADQSRTDDAAGVSRSLQALRDARRAADSAAIRDAERFAALQKQVMAQQ